MNYNVIKTVVFSLLTSVLVSCSQPDKRCCSFAESWNRKCPIALVKDEATITSVRYSGGKFILSISVSDSAPTSVLSLRKLNDEYSKRIEEDNDYYQNGMVLGGLPFIKGVISESPILAQIIDSISTLTYTPESTQGYLPLVIKICDDIDSLAYTYNEEWEYLPEHEWMNAIMPTEMCAWSSNPSPLPPLNKVVRVEGIPRISNERLLKIYCSYDASPYYTRSGEPVCIDDIKGKSFSKKILENYLADLMAKSENIRRFLNACERRGIGIQFIVEGFKDGIDYDLSTPELIKQWENWGGSDSIIVSLPIQKIGQTKTNLPLS